MGLVRPLLLGVVVGALCASCGATSEPADYRIERPDAKGTRLIEVLIQRLVTPMGRNGEQTGEVLDAATDGQRALYWIEVADLEVDDGGFAQLFYNDGESVTGDASEAAERVGARNHARILRDAVEVLATLETPTDDDYSAWVPKGELGRQLDSLDQRWVAHDPELDRRLLAYIEQHPNEVFR